MHAGTKIKIARISKSLSQQELADKVNKTRPLISSIEQTGKGSFHTIKKICDVLGIDFNDLESNDAFPANEGKIRELNLEIIQLKKDNERLQDLVNSQKELILVLKEKSQKNLK